MEKREQFGNRFLTDPRKIFEHNAWDDVQWDEEQESEAKKKVESNSQDLVKPDVVENLEVESDKYWDKFYGIHQNRFFKDRKWLFTEFPELLNDKQQPSNCIENAQDTSHKSDDLSSTTKQQHGNCELHEVRTGAACSSTKSADLLSNPSDEGVRLIHASANSAERDVTENDRSVSSEVIQTVPKMNDVISNCEVTSCTEKINDVTISGGNGTTIETESWSDGHKNSFPGCSAAFRIFEVGCGVGNTVFPVLETNNDPDIFVYCCDLSSTAIDLVKEHHLYDVNRCHAFVCDVTNMEETLPFPEDSLDVITLIFVFSAISPDKMQSTVDRLARCLKPGGLILFRDYGRYDLCQLRFKNGQCLSENFYARQDGTRVYFFTQEELREMFTKAGLTEEQNIVDRRLQVNRGRQIKMYRVWMQCKYRKPLKTASS